MSALNQVLGPSYSYPNNIPSPRDMRFTKADTVSKLAHNVGGIRKYIEILASHPAYGNNFFLKTGKCDPETSEPQCQGKDRYLFVRNIPSGKIPCIGDPGISFDGGIGARGIIPGIMEDVIEINPLELPKALTKTSVKFGNACKLQSRVTGGVGEKQKVETRCSPQIPDNACPFNFGGGGKNTNKKRLGRLLTSLGYLLLVVLVILLFTQNR